VKINPLIIKTIFGAILLLSAFLGIKAATFSYEYEVVTEGLLGSFFIYLFLRVFWPSTMNRDSSQYTISQAVKLTTFVFIYSIMCFWALVRIANLIEFILSS